MFRRIAVHRVIVCSFYLFSPLILLAANHSYAMVNTLWQLQQARPRIVARTPLRSLVNSVKRAHGYRIYFSTAQNSVPNDDASIGEYNTTFLLEEIKALNDGKHMNVQSPKQVAQAVFGKIQCTNRQALNLAAEGRIEGLSHRQQRLAGLVLAYRRNIRQNNVQQRTRANRFSALADFECNPVEKQAKQETTNGVPSPVASVHPSDILESEEVPRVLGQSSSYEKRVDELFVSRNTQIHPVWQEVLRQVSRPAGRAIVEQLNPDICPMGYDPTALPLSPLRAQRNIGTSTAGKKGSFLAFCREQKNKYPDCIILTRCGDFYETFGVDAIMLVEYCGLNAMAGKAKAGCPKGNVQTTIDCLTAQGFRVAVYEEASDTDSSAGAGSAGGSKSRLKRRFLAQIVSPASPTYLYNLVLLGNSDALLTDAVARPYIGIISQAAGYSLVEVSLEERTARVTERLTAEAVACHLAAHPPADPLFYVPSISEKVGGADITQKLPFLPSRLDVNKNGPGARMPVRVLPPTLVQSPKAGVTDVERAKTIILSELLSVVETKEEDESERITVNDFVLLLQSNDAKNTDRAIQTHPLYRETATQLGLMGDPTIPSLLSYVLPEFAPAATKRFLRRLLLSPPPPLVGGAISDLVSFLKDSKSSVPPLSVPPVGKILSLLRAGQASAPVYGEILRALYSTLSWLECSDSESADMPTSQQVEALMVVLEYESGLAGDPQSLKERCRAAMEVIEDVISPLHHVHFRESIQKSSSIEDTSSELEVDWVPRAFFERNEASWRGRIRREASPDTYFRVEKAKRALSQAVAIDYWGEGSCASTSASPVTQDIFNNMIALKTIPPFVGENTKGEYFHPRDRNGKVLRNRFTTARVQESLTDYITACDQACNDVAEALSHLSESLSEKGHVPAIVQAAHFNLILSAAFHHACRSNEQGWSLVKMVDEIESSDFGGQFNGVWPYWMDQADAVPNSFSIGGMWLLTAPNMSGKSTLMRSTAATALLSACGLCAPTGKGSKLRRFDHLFVRGASADVPTEQKSAFGAEMGDIASLLRSCGSRSLVFVDELGRGTSPHDGTRLAGAILESMAVAGMSGIFATHLHGILQLPIQAMDRITKKRMGMRAEDPDCGSKEEDYKWTYTVEDGVCTDSMALWTAERFGLPLEIISRAKEFSSYLNDGDNSTSNAAKIKMSEGTSILAKIQDFSGAVTLAEGCMGQQSVAIPAAWTVPASLYGKSCVYVLQLENPPRLYVGESDSLSSRIAQHRKKGPDWKYADAVAFPVEKGGKSIARMYESRLIRKLAQAGFSMESTADGRSRRSSHHPLLE